MSLVDNDRCSKEPVRHSSGGLELAGDALLSWDSQTTTSLATRDGTGKPIRRLVQAHPL